MPGNRRTITEYSGRIVNVSDITVTGEGGVTNIETKGGTLQMTTEVTPTNADNTAVSWSVVNGTGKATIDSSGLLRAQSNGTVGVIATAQDGTGVTGNQTITISGANDDFGQWMDMGERK